MKSTTTLLGLVLCGTALLISPLVLTEVANAEAKTQGSVQFKTQGDDSTGDVILPGTEEEVIFPETGNHSTGPLRFTHVPDFDFNVVEIESKSVLTNAMTEKYRMLATDPASLAKDISNFVQVEDVRGEQKDWSVTVSASPFTAADPKITPLEKTHIVLQEGKLFNTRMTSAEIENAVTHTAKGLTLTTEGKLLMATTEGANTDSSKTSLVFNNAYSKDEPAGGTTEKEGRLYNPGVQLQVVGTDEKMKDVKYVSTITWTLVSGI